MDDRYDPLSLRRHAGRATKLPGRGDDLGNCALDRLRIGVAVAVLLDASQLNVHLLEGIAQ